MAGSEAGMCRLRASAGGYHRCQQSLCVQRRWVPACDSKRRQHSPILAEAEGLMRKLNGMLAPPTESMRPDWRIADVLGTWYR